MSLMTWILRKTFAASDTRRDAGLTSPDDLERMDDICYGTDAGWQVLDVYRPRGTTCKLPVIVSIHGGGWTYGDKERYQWYCMSLAQRGFAVVNFTYRVAPEFKFPCGIEDTNLVFQWLLSHDDWFDTERVYAVGDSAGAHMLTIYSTMCTNPDYALLFDIPPAKYPDGRPFSPHALGLNCGVYQIDLHSKHTSAMTKGLMKALLRDHGSEIEMKQINPIPYITSDFPRAFVMTANKDPLAGPPSQNKLIEQLRTCGVHFEEKTYGTEKKPLGHVFHCNIRDESAKRCNDDECRFFMEGA